MELIKTTSEKDLNDLYENDALTWEGMTTDDDNLRAIKNWIEEHGSKLIKDEFYVTSGKLMNDVYQLTNENAYPDSLNILSIRLDNIQNLENIILARFEVGGRWFSDIVDNNVMREKNK